MSVNLSTNYWFSPWVYDDLNAYHHLFRKNPQGASLKAVREYVKLINIASVEELKQYDVIFCTTAVAGNPKLLQAAQIYQCIIDEAGMCREPEAMLPIIAAKPKQVVLIGDHKQLRPIVKCREAAELGLQKSLFERYAPKATFLNEQYRMVSEY